MEAKTLRATILQCSATAAVAQLHEEVGGERLNFVAVSGHSVTDKMKLFPSYLCDYKQDVILSICVINTCMRVL